MLVVEVLGDRVPAPGSAAKRRRRREAVRQGAARSEGAGLVDDKPADGQLDAGAADVAFVVRVQGRRMAGALDEEIRFRGSHGLLERLVREDRDNRAKLLF